jgi:hypothetical protein
MPERPTEAARYGRGIIHPWDPIALGRPGGRCLLDEVERDRMALLALGRRFQSGLGAFAAEWLSAGASQALACPACPARLTPSQDRTIANATMSKKIRRGHRDLAVPPRWVRPTRERGPDDPYTGCRMSLPKTAASRPSRGARQGWRQPIQDLDGRIASGASHVQSHPAGLGSVRGTEGASSAGIHPVLGSQSQLAKPIASTMHGGVGGNG